MNKMVLIIAACGLAFGPAVADTYKLDTKGKCHDDKGKFAKQSLCATTTSAHTYKLDAKNKCRDEKGKFAEAKLCKA